MGSKQQIEFVVEPERDRSYMTVREQWFSVFHSAYQDLVFHYAAPRKSRIELWEEFCNYYWEYDVLSGNGYKYSDKKMHDAALFVAHGGHLTLAHNTRGFGWLRRPKNPIMYGYGDTDALTREWSDNFPKLWPWVLLVAVIAWMVF